MTSALILKDVHSGYGRSTVLHGVSLSLKSGTSLAVLGRNGAGKSTLLATLAGVTQQHQGDIILDGLDISRLPSHKRARLGLAWVPQERAVFASLTVEENLSVVARPGPWDLPRVYDCFPRLAERRNHAGRHLSGGEQQMLAIGRALMLNPRVILLDEPLEGLAPQLAETLLQTLTELLQTHAITLIIVEQNPRQVLPITDQTIILERGCVVHQATSSSLMHDTATVERWLGVRNQSG